MTKVGDENKVATVGDIVNTINKVSHNLTIKYSNEQLKVQTTVSPAQVKAGSTVTYEAAKNLIVNQNGTTITYGLAKDVDLGKDGSLKVNNVTIDNNGINAGGDRITNVKAGENATDAVNVSQLRGNITNINNRINKVSKEARSGIAGANAAASLPQVYLPGKSMMAASAGTFKGENAFSVGYSRASDNGKLILKLQGNVNSQGDVGAGVGVGYQW